MSKLDKEIIELYTKKKNNPTLICKTLNIKSTHTVYGVLKKYGLQESRKASVQPEETYNKLTVIKKISSDQKGVVWECKCKCGKTTKAKTHELLCNKKVSCGCWRKRGPNHKSWTGYGEISGQLWSCYKKGAKKRNLSFTITIEYVWELFIEQDRKCKLTGRTIFFSERSKDFRTNLSTASLDRIDSSKGYIPGNVQWVHKHINMMKSSLPQEEFIDICKEVCSNQNIRFY